MNYTSSRVAQRHLLGFAWETQNCRTQGQNKTTPIPKQRIPKDRHCFLQNHPTFEFETTNHESDPKVRVSVLCRFFEGFSKSQGTEGPTHVLPAHQITLALSGQKRDPTLTRRKKQGTPRKKHKNRNSEICIAVLTCHGALDKTSDGLCSCFLLNKSWHCWVARFSSQIFSEPLSSIGFFSMIFVCFCFNCRRVERSFQSKHLLPQRQQEGILSQMRLLLQRCCST